MTKQGKETKNVRLSIEHHTELKILAAKEGVSIQKYLEKLISKSI